MPMSIGNTSQLTPRNTSPPDSASKSSSNPSPIRNGVCSASPVSKWPSTPKAAPKTRNTSTQHPATGAGLIELGTFLKYEKQLKNLQLQESRLQRRYEKEMAELRSLQKERKQQAGKRKLNPRR